MVDLGWSLPPGCENVPGDEPLPPCCEECPEEMHTNCPGEDNCEVFQKLVKDEADVDQQMCDDYIETEKVARDAGFWSGSWVIGAQEPPDDPRIFNRKQKDGTHRPISEFFEPPEKGVETTAKLILVCLTCSGAGSIPNTGFEACRDDPCLPEGECDTCPVRERCKQGEWEDCPVCDGMGAATYSADMWAWKIEEAGA